MGGIPSGPHVKLLLSFLIALVSDHIANSRRRVAYNSVATYYRRGREQIGDGLPATAAGAVERGKQRGLRPDEQQRARLMDRNR